MTQKLEHYKNKNRTFSERFDSEGFFLMVEPEPEDAKLFYEMMGRAISLWGRFENALVDDVAAVCKAVPSIRPLVLKGAPGFGGDIDRLVKCFETIVALQPYAPEARKLRDIALTVYAARNMLMHGSFLGFRPGNSAAAVFRKWQLKPQGLWQESLVLSTEDIRQIALDTDSLHNRLLTLTFRFSTLDAPPGTGKP